VTVYPHLLVAILSACQEATLAYPSLVLASTCASILWHRSGETSAILFWIDHALALLWGVVDTLHSPPTLLLNVPVGLAYFVEAFPHEYWHLLHLTKSLAVASLRTIKLK
jgi:hypothetical protein